MPASLAAHPVPGQVAGHQEDQPRPQSGAHRSIHHSPDRPEDHPARQGDGQAREEQRPHGPHRQVDHGQEDRVAGREPPQPLLVQVLLQVEVLQRHHRGDQQQEDEGANDRRLFAAGGRPRAGKLGHTGAPDTKNE